MELNKLYNQDCMEGMREFPDKYFDLAIVDPPYGINITRSFIRKTPSIDKRNGRPIITKGRSISKSEWDKVPPKKEYFNELFRISRNQIIWGGNHFNNMPASSCWIVWDKVNGKSDQADCELAWTSFKTAVRQFRFMWCIAQGKQGGNGHIAEGNNKLWEKKIHPTQKPVALYKWLLRNYAKPTDKIIDTHVGSGSSIISFEDFGCEYIGFELDKDYFEATTKRINNHKAQLIIKF